MQIESTTADEQTAETTYETHFQNSGVSYVASSGDGGAGAEWPAVSPNVLSVGQNTLNGSAETGVTSQANFSSLLGTHRVTPDVSLGNSSSGAAVYDSTATGGQTGWFQVSGASVTTPEWAGLVALADQQRTTKFSSSNLMTDLYSLAGSTNFHVGGGTGPSGLLGSPIANVLVPNLTTAP